MSASSLFPKLLSTLLLLTLLAELFAGLRGHWRRVALARQHCSGSPLRLLAVAFVLLLTLRRGLTPL